MFQLNLMFNCLLKQFRSFVRKTPLFFWYCLAIAIFIIVFLCNVVAIVFDSIELKFIELFKLLYAVPVLITLCSLGAYVFRLRRKVDIERYRFYFLGFIVLIFTVIYSVSFMGYDIQGVKRMQQYMEQSKQYKEETKEIAQENKEVSAKTQIAAQVVGIINLAEKAHWKSNGGDLQSYKSLKLLQSTTQNKELKKVISEQIEVIKNAYSAENLWISADSLNFICQLSQPPCAKGLEPDTKFNAKNIYDHSTELYKLWPEHARAASLLRNYETATHKDKVAVDDINKSLIRLMKNENEKLMVRKIALETLKYLNDFHPKLDDIFDFNSAISQWENRAN